MTDIARYDHGGTPQRRAAGPEETKADKARQSLAFIRKEYLAPFDAWDRIKAEQEAERQAMAVRPAFLAPRVYRPHHPRTEADRRDEIARFDAALKAQPNPRSLASIREAFRNAANGKPKPSANRLIAGFMVGAFPNVRPHSPETYLETLIEALDQTGFPPAAVARACNEIIHTSTFAPTIAEVVAKAKDVHAHLRFSAQMIDRYEEVLIWAAGVRSWLAAVPLLDENRSNYERPPEPPRSLSYSASRVDWV